MQSYLMLTFMPLYKIHVEVFSFFIHYTCRSIQLFFTLHYAALCTSRQSLYFSIKFNCSSYQVLNNSLLQKTSSFTRKLCVSSGSKTKICGYPTLIQICGCRTSSEKREFKKCELSQ